MWFQYCIISSQGIFYWPFIAFLRGTTKKKCPLSSGFQMLSIWLAKSKLQTCLLLSVILPSSGMFNCHLWGETERLSQDLSHSCLFVDFDLYVDRHIVPSLGALYEKRTSSLLFSLNVRYIGAMTNSRTGLGFFVFFPQWNHVSMG